MDVASGPRALSCAAGFYGAQIAITLKPGASTIKSCLIEDIRLRVSGDHCDGVFFAGGENNVLIEDNYMVMRSDFGTANIFVHTEYDNSPINGVNINHNRLLGTPSRCVYLGDPTHVNINSPISNIQFTNNECQRGSGGYAIVDPRWAATRVISGNVDAFTFVNIDNNLT